MERLCVGCGADISHRASQARTCSLTCQKRAWTRRHAEVNRERARAWYYANPEKAAASRKAYAATKPGIVRAAKRRWAERNPHKRASDDIARKTRRQQATPVWADQGTLRKIYESARLLSRFTGIEFEVDHIYPIRSKVVCGLHCEANLQIITAAANNRKNNRCPEMLPVVILAFPKKSVA